MIIEVNPDWRIESDRMNYSLCQRVVVKKGERVGEEDWVAEGYYSSAASALYALVKHEVATAEQVLDIKGFVRLYKDVAERFAQRIPTKQAEEIIQKLGRVDAIAMDDTAESVTGVKTKPKRAPSKA